MTTNQQNIENMTALIEALEVAIIAATKTDLDKAHTLHLARDAAISARMAAQRGDNDGCGRALEIARARIQEARA